MLINLWTNLLTFQIVSIDPNPAGINQMMFISGTSLSSWTSNGVNNWPMTIPMGLLIPKRIVAMVLCSSLNQCWLILVGTQDMNGQAIPVKAWPIRARLNLSFGLRSSLRWGSVLRQQSRPPEKCSVYDQSHVWLFRNICDKKNCESSITQVAA